MPIPGTEGAYSCKGTSMKQYLCVYQRDSQNFYQTFNAVSDKDVYEHCAQQPDIQHVLFVVDSIPVDHVADCSSKPLDGLLDLSKAHCILRRKVED